MVTSPALRLALAAVATVIGLTLVFSYRTSTSPTPTTAGPAAVVPNRSAGAPRHHLGPDTTLDSSTVRPHRSR